MSEHTGAPALSAGVAQRHDGGQPYDGDEPRPAPAPDPGPAPRVTLRGGELPWQPVSPGLTRIRLITLGLALLVPLAGALALALLLSRWFWLLVAGLVLLGGVLAWVVGRQVSAISWIELDDELVIRKGRLLRSLVSVPYGRLQFVDVQSGPLMRSQGLARLELHTANPATDATLPGLTTKVAEDLRARLSARGETQRAGL